MTDRPTLEDLDATPDDVPWCCNGNAEDCALCTDPNPNYPWICPGHDRTAANERIVAEATRPAEQPAAQPWTQLEARAFNAVQPALNKAGAWLPMSVRRKVANAVLEAVQAAELQAAVDRVRELADDAEYGTYTVDVDTLRSALPEPPTDTVPDTVKEA